MKVIAIAGMPGAGKSTLINEGIKRGAYSIRMGDLVIEEVNRLGLEITDSNVGHVADKVRQEHRAKLYGNRIPLELFDVEIQKIMEHEGYGIWAKKTVEKIKKESKSELVLIDGVRGNKEIDIFRTYFNNFVTLSIFSSRKDRLERILRRSREDDISGLGDLKGRDRRELSWGLGKVIAMSDHMIINDCSFKEFHKRIKDFFRKIIK